MGLEGLLAQLDDEGLTTTLGEVILIPWDQVFQLIENEQYSGCDELLGLPASAEWVPSLQSFGSLTDRDFGIVVADWYDSAGGRLRDVRVCGAVTQHGEQLRLAPAPGVGDPVSYRRISTAAFQTG